MREKDFVIHLINKMKANREETNDVTRHLIRPVFYSMIARKKQSMGGA